jgi:hypothetical protein
MSVATKQQIHAQLEQARRLLIQSSDQTTIDGLRTHIEDLETKLLLIMNEGPQA